MIVCGLLAPNNAEQFVRKGFWPVLTNTLLQRVFPALDSGVIDMTLPANPNASQESPAPYYSDADVPLTRWTADDLIHSMIAVAPTFHGYAPLG